MRKPVLELDHSSELRRVDISEPANSFWESSVDKWELRVPISVLRDPISDLVSTVRGILKP